MGQQQLLLLVLGIVIVGIAIVVGINAYSENSVKSNWDAVLQDGLRIASDAQSWKGKPELFGGSPDATKGDSADYNNMDFTDIGFPPSDDGILCYDNLNGSFSVDGLTTGLTILGQNTPYNNQVQLFVNGVREANVQIGSIADPDENIVKGGLDETGATATLATLVCT